MTIKLYNTKTRKKEPFTPLDEKNVRMYVCGPTVYDRAHIGNARPVVVFDVLYRLLRHTYGADHVTYVRNFTDVDDKINARAAETGRNIREITDETIGWYHDDMDALGTLRPDVEPRATEYIEQMKAMIGELIAKGFAYEAEGHVLFEVEKYAGYGKLSGRSLDDMIAGARVEVAPYKRNPMDFVMWKPSTRDQPGWDSDWGYGRPGWHIECSAMAKELLGEVFDIHGGGIDLSFPHHENERAQSCAAHGTDAMAQVWMHNGFLNVEGEKMSKSLGNFFTVRELLEPIPTLHGTPFSGPELRIGLLMTHYRQPMDFGVKRRREAREFLEKALRDLAHHDKQELVTSSDVKVPEDVLSSLMDDLNTAEALNILGRRVFRKEVRRSLPKAQSLVKGLELLGVSILRGKRFDTYRELQKQQSSKTLDLLSESSQGEPVVIGLFENEEVRALVKELAAKWNGYRTNKDFANADKIKDLMIEAGLVPQVRELGVLVEVRENFDASKLGALK